MKLYTKIKKTLKPSGIFIEGEYIVPEEEEQKLMEEYNRFVASVENYKHGDYHIDIPFSLKNQKKLISEAGFEEFDLVLEKEYASIYIAK